MIKYTQYIPALTTIAFLAALLFDAGMFLVIGPEWMAFLSIQDLFSISWPIIPIILLAMMGYVYEITLNYEPFKLLYAYRKLSISDKKPWDFANRTSIISGIISILGLGSILASPLISTFFGPIWVSTTLTAFALITSPLFALFIWNKENQGLRRAGYYAMHVAVLIVAIGGDHARDEVYGKEFYLLKTLHADPICGRVLFSGNRGVLISTSTDASRTFISTAEVSRLDKILGPKCPMKTK